MTFYYTPFTHSDFNISGSEESIDLPKPKRIKALRCRISGCQKEPKRVFQVGYKNLTFCCVHGFEFLVQLVRDN